MDMTALIPFVCREEGPYFCLANEVAKERYDAPMEALGLPGDDAASNARVFSLVDVPALAEDRHGEAFARWLEPKPKTEKDLSDEGGQLLPGTGVSDGHKGN